jgi:small subunit ribosomal protein S21
MAGRGLTCPSPHPNLGPLILLYKIVFKLSSRRHSVDKKEVNTMSTVIKVEIEDRGGVERSLRKFKRLCDNYGVVKEYRKRQEHKKPSIKLKEKNEAAEKRRRKASFKVKRGPNS